MTPQELEQFNKMLKQVSEIYEWMQQRRRQLVPYPLDDVSKTILAIPDFSSGGLGATALTQVYSTGLGDTVTAPKAYSDTIIIRIKGINYEVPFLANPT